MLGRCGTGASLLAKALMPLRKPGRVTRSCIVSGSWQSMQATGWSTSLPGVAASGMAQTFSKPFITSPSPALR